MCFVSADRRVISDVTVTPHDDRTLLVQWRSLVSSSLTGFVVEWRPLLKTDLSLTRFEITDKNQTSLAITGMFYSICIAGFRFLLFFFPCPSYFTRLLFGFPNPVFILYHKNSLLCKVFFFLCTPCRYKLVISLWELIHSNLFTLINRQLWALQALWDLCVS